MLKPLRIFMLLGVMLAVAYYAGVRYVQHIPLQLAAGIHTVAPGSSAAQLCRLWQQQQLIQQTDCLLLRLYLKLHPAEAAVQQGVYRVNDEQTLLDVLALFRSGREAQFALTLIEGETLQQSLQRISQATHLQQDISSAEQVLQLMLWPQEWAEPPSNAEALLFPDTYYYTANSMASALIKRAQQALLTELDHAWQQRHGDLPLQNRYQLLTLASIIEKESSYAPEKTLVASVFVNRLRKNMRLQTDPTVIYGLENFNGDITRADLNNPHRYNTYRHHGLPPGPISLVGRAALMAAAQPAETDLYYFVSKGDGTHQFSSTLQQHNAAVEKYILGSKP
ncbi:endolytic transglycosylase MltG [Rheinheimera maricola]|uniref:Endolytic murein transglycosylase n=1 Tax=Rheinheimera maricola TaxID=2793282 RepID=A0ABS7XGQ7_9GAMM|nr:endolytic transglycosylase MltG [Rheinheimera maricola]MBZ9613712.1 endolytic transglycosylase MltG [Rheinheimera maricola]